MADLINNDESVVAPTEASNPGLTFYSDGPEPVKEKPSFYQTAKSAAELDNLLTRTLINNYNTTREAQFPVDMDYNFRDHEDELVGDLPTEYHGRVAEGASLEQAQFIRSSIDMELDTKKTVEDAGGTGIAARVLVSFGSPENLLPGASIGALAKTNRVRSAITLGGTAGITNGAAELALTEMSETKDLSDVAWAASLGFAAGGAIGLIAGKTGVPRIKTPTDDEAISAAGKTMRTDLETEAVVDAQINVARKDAGAAENIGWRATQEEAAGELEGARILDANEIQDDIIVDSTLWAKDKDIANQLQNSWTNKAANANKLTRSDYTQIINHPSAVVKRIAYDLLEGGTGTLGRTKSASVVKDLYERRMLSRAMLPMDDAFKQWARDSGRNFADTHVGIQARQEYFGAVRTVLNSRAIGQADPSNVSPSVLKGADAWGDMMEEAHHLGTSSGMTAFQGIKKNRGFVPLKWNGDAMFKMGRETATDLIAKGYRSAGIPEEIIDDIASAVVKRRMENVAGFDADISGMLGKDQRGALRGALRDMGIEDDAISRMMVKLDDAADEAGPGYTKARTKIDLNVTSGSHKLSDLVDNDLHTIAGSYTRDVSGRVALAQKGIKNDADWDNLVQAALRDPATLAEMNTRGVKTGKELEEYLSDIKTMFTSAPTAGGASKNVRRLKSATTLSSLGQVGFAQLAEVGTVIGRMGVRGLGDMMTNLKSLKHGSPEMVELRGLLGDFDMDHRLYRPDVFLDDSGRAAGSIGATLDNGLGKSEHMLGYLSGMNVVRQLEHRMAMKLMLNRVVDIVDGKTTVAAASNLSGSKTSAARLADIGLDEDTLNSVVDNIKRYRSGDKLNFAKWDDNVAEDFAVALNRHTAQVVQRQLVGETSTWMHKSTGQILTQFRTFPMVAFEKQLLRNLQHMDQELLTTALYGFAVSYGVAYIKAIANGKDPEDMQLYKPAINYMGIASLAPEVGTVAAQFGLAPEELNFRKLGHTGASPADDFGLQDYIPSISYGNKVAKAATLPAGIISGEATDGDKRAAFGALPLSNTLFMKRLFEAMFIE